MNYGVPVGLLRFLGACVYGDAAAYYRALDESGRAALEREGCAFGQQAWLYRFLYDELPEERRAKYRKVYQLRQAQAVQGEHALRIFFDELSAHGLRFAPIKGADLTWRIYPDAALRHGNDWDVWFHPDDCEKALDVLAETGWQAPECYTDGNDAVFKTALHHYSPHVRGAFTVEPHYTLANFGDADPHDMWEFTMESPGGGGRHVLTPEMNVLMLARHAASQSYYHAQLPKLLIDVAMVMRHDDVGFAKLRAMSDRWHLPYPGDLLAAFPEFFPADVLAKFGANPERSALFRSIFEARGKLGEPNTTTLVFSRSRAKGEAAASLADHLLTICPAKIRRVYRLPKHGAWGSVCRCYADYFWTRTTRVLSSLLGRDRTMLDYCRLVESAESSRPDTH